MINLQKDHFIHSDGTNWIVSKTIIRSGEKRIAHVTFHQTIFHAWKSAKRIFGDKMLELPERKKLEKLYVSLKDLPDNVIERFTIDDQYVDIQEKKGEYRITISWNTSPCYYCYDKQSTLNKAFNLIMLKKGQGGSLNKMIKTVKENIALIQSI